MAIMSLSPLVEARGVKLNYFWGGFRIIRIKHRLNTPTFRCGN